MKNNGGWGLRAELVICLVLTIFFGIAVLLIGKVVNTLNDTNVNDNNNPVINDNNVIIKDNNKNDTDLKNENIDKEESEIEENVNYNTLEDKLVRAGVMYANKYYKDSKLTVTVVRLQTEGILNELSMEDTKCSGYIEIEKDESFKYYPYIKCADLYQTQGYEEVKDNLDN